MRKIFVADMTLAENNKGAASLSFKEKIDIARQLDKLGVDVIELSPIENVTTDTLLIKTISSFAKNSVISVPVGMTENGVKAAHDALMKAEKPRLRVVLPVSPVQMEYMSHLKAPKMIERIELLVSECAKVCGDVEFFAQDATRSEKEFLYKAVETAIKAGAKTVTLSDDAGDMMPDEIENFVSDIISEIPEIKNGSVRLGMVCNNKMHLAPASAITAVKAGADEIKVSVGGGMYPTVEEIANVIKNRGDSMGVYTELTYTELSRITSRISWISNTKRSEMSPFDNGVVSENEYSDLSLNNHDDINAVSNAVKKLGYDLTDEDYAKVYEAFLRVAEKKPVGAKELEAIVASAALQVPPTYRLISHVINCGNVINASAQIKLAKGGSEIQGICIGDGPIDAAFLAIEQIVGHHYELDDFQIQAVTEGREAMGSAIVKLRNNGKLYSGHGISTDIISASIRAYLSALNKIAYEEN